MDRADRDFARLLDDERADSDRDVEFEAAQPAPAQAPAVETPAQPEPVQASGESPAVEQSADNKATAAAAFQAALNALNADDVSPAADGAVTEQQTTNASTEANAATPTTATTPAATTAATVSALTSNPALLVLASANAASTVSGTQSSGKQTGESGKTASSDESGNGDSSSIEGTVVAAHAGVTQTAAATAAASDEGKVAVAPRARDGAGAALLLDDIAPDGDATPATTKDVRHVDTAPTQSANSAASSQTNAHAAANAVTPANGVTAAAASTDSTSQLAANTSSVASQANAQTVANGNTPTEASRAAPTPPALQSAPAATIQVYTRLIERADGRAQRFEVRLDPAELGRVDIRIEIGADRKVHAVMAAHDSAALTDLMRGQKSLERALSDAGIDLAENGLRFEVASDSSRGGASQQRDGDANGRSSPSDAWRKFDTTTIPVSAEAAAAATPMRRTQRLDLVA